MSFALDDEADVVVLATLGLVSVWMAWLYWPAAHEVIAQLMC